MSRSGAGRDTGRPGALGQARELVALASSLSEAGDSLSADAVAARLGMGRAQAEKLVGLLATAATADGTGLPLVEDGDGALTLLLDAGVRGRRLKLNLAETAALLAALDRMGVAADDPLRERLEGSLPGDAPDEGLVHRMLGELSSGGGVLLTCARALREGMEARHAVGRCVPRGFDTRRGAGISTPMTWGGMASARSVSTAWKASRPSRRRRPRRAGHAGGHTRSR